MTNKSKHSEEVRGCLDNGCWVGGRQKCSKKMTLREGGGDGNGEKGLDWGKKPENLKIPFFFNRKNNFRKEKS